MTPSDGELAGKVSVILGGGGEIGRSVCLELAAYGSHVVVLDLRLEKAQSVRDAILKAGGSASSEAVDVLDFTSSKRVLENVRIEHGQIDFLTFLVGWVRVEPSLDVTPETFDRTVRTNLTAQFVWAQAAATLMLDQTDGGSIVLIGSVLGYGGIPRRAAYTASRGGVIQLVRTLAVEWAPLKIRVNSVAPGWVETQPLLDLGLPLEDYRDRTPMGRLATPDDVSGPFRFFASDASKWVTGVSLPVDGGASAYIGPSKPGTA